MKSRGSLVDSKFGDKKPIRCSNRVGKRKSKWVLWRTIQSRLWGEMHHDMWRVMFFKREIIRSHN